MTDKNKARVEEVREAIKWKVAVHSQKCASDKLLDSILSLKDKDGKPMLGIISDDQDVPSCPNYGSLMDSADCQLYMGKAMLASNFRRVIVGLTIK